MFDHRSLCFHIFIPFPLPFAFFFSVLVSHFVDIKASRVNVWTNVVFCFALSVQDIESEENNDYKNMASICSSSKTKESKKGDERHWSHLVTKVSKGNLNVFDGLHKARKDRIATTSFPTPLVSLYEKKKDERGMRNNLVLCVFYLPFPFCRLATWKRDKNSYLSSLHPQRHPLKPCNLL